jgi:hypothetical protein
MNHPQLNCQDERRRLLARHKNLNGIDYVEVDETQTLLCVHLFAEVPTNLTKANLRIAGGRRIRDIQILDVYAEKEDDPELGECLRVVVDKPGDFSTYTLSLFAADERGKPTGKPLEGFDRRYSSVEFSFKVNCPSDLDCRSDAGCPPEARPQPDINYLAKDYASFRQLILDRMALLMPDWQERHVPDIGIALVEVLAYVGDYLSYYQDAVATEAYIDTARLRISVRRHARLVDYRMHEGCNARAWLFLETDTDRQLDAREIYFVTNTIELEDFGKRLLKQSELEQLRIPASHYDVFEPLVEGDKIQIYAAHSKLRFYTWGDAECCLAKGATRATLKDEWLSPEANPPQTPQQQGYQQTPKQQAAYEVPKPPAERPRKLHLQAGDVLIFEEVLGAKTGNPADADLTHRHVVRLTRVEPGEDSLLNQPVVEIEWSEADALPFTLCISAVLPAPDCQLLADISVARGNVILVDHGKTTHESLGEVPLKTTVGDCECGSVETTKIAGKFQPILQSAPLTFSQPADASMPAALMLNQDPRQALPQVKSLLGRPPMANQTTPGEGNQQSDKQKGKPEEADFYWYAQSDLFDSRSDDRHFVVEMDNNRQAHLRFGNGEMGRLPEALTEFTADYRTGNGTAGNVGAEAITYLVVRQGTLSGIEIQPRNPLPAQGGVEAEPLAEVKMFAPGAIRKDLQRAITADDYARLTERHQKIQRAAAEILWTGSWYEARVSVDQRGTADFEESLRQEIEKSLYRYRRMGQDLSIIQADYVPLEIELLVCVAPHYQRGQVQAALLEAFSNRLLPDGRRGFFQADNLTFGEGIYLSKLVASAQAVAGVQSVTVNKLQRRFEADAGELGSGILALGSMEIAQLDNDPNFPEHGKLTLVMRGGR